MNYKTGVWGMNISRLNRRVSENVDRRGRHVTPFPRLSTWPDLRRKVTMVGQHTHTLLFSTGLWLTAQKLQNSKPLPKWAWHPGSREYRPWMTEKLWPPRLCGRGEATALASFSTPLLKAGLFSTFPFIKQETQMLVIRLPSPAAKSHSVPKSPVYCYLCVC